MPRLHRRYDRLQCLRIVDVAREYLVAQGKPVKLILLTQALCIAYGSLTAGEQCAFAVEHCAR
jgi:hypothetical protein